MRNISLMNNLEVMTELITGMHPDITSTDKMLLTLSSMYGNKEDKLAIRNFTQKNTYHEIPFEAVLHFKQEYTKSFNLTASNVLNGCFEEVRKNEGFYVVNHPNLNSQYVFLYKKYSNFIIIHPFEIFNDEWNLITPMQVLIENDELNISTLSECTATPDGNGGRHTVPDSYPLERRNYNLAFFCFISIYCAD